MDSARLNTVNSDVCFIIQKFLSGGPFARTLKVFNEEIEKNKIFLKRLDWEGNEHDRSVYDMIKQFPHIRPDYLLYLTSWNGVSSLLSFPANCRHESGVLTNVRQLLCYVIRKNSTPKQDVSNTFNIVNILRGRETAGSISKQRSITPKIYSSFQSQRLTIGHLSAVYCILFDRSGKYIITGADDFLVKVWSTYTGRLIFSFRGSISELTDIAINVENTLIATGSLDRILRVWNLQTGAPVAVLMGHTGMITSVNFCPTPCWDVRYLISTSTDGSLAFWSYTSDSYHNVAFKTTSILYQERVRPGQAQMICSSFSPGGVFLVTGSADHHVRIYYMKGEEGPHRILEMELHGDRVDSIQWAHSGLKFLSGSKDGTAIVWWFEKQQWKSTLLDMSTKLTGADVPDSEAKKLKVTMVAWNTSDQIVAAAVSDFTLKVWTATGTLEKVLLGHTDEVYVLEPHPYHENIMLSAGHDGQVFIWDIYKGEKVFKYLNTIEGHGFGAIFDVKWNPDGTIFAASDSHGHIITFGFGSGSTDLKNLPKELFFHTDYRPLVLDDNHWVLDEQTQMQPHQMPPPFLVDIDGNPYPPMLQRLVPGRELCNVEQLVPNILIGEEGAQEIIQEIPPPPANLEDDEEDFRGGGSPRRQGIRSRDTERIRQSTGDWQADPTFEWKKNVVVRPLSKAVLAKTIKDREGMRDSEIEEYQRQLRMRPHMISISTMNTAKRKEDKKGKRKNGKYVTRSTRVQYEPKEEIFDSSEDADYTDSSGSSDWMEEQGRNRKMRSKRKRRSDTVDSNDDEDEDEDDFEAQVAEALQSSESDTGDLDSVEVERTSRNSRKRDQNQRTRNDTRVEVVDEPTPSTSTAKASSVTKDDCMPSTSGYTPNSKFKTLEQYRPCEWLSETRPRKSPYYPQMGDEIVYFVQGHQLYLNAVRVKKLYEINYKEMPWNKCKIKDHVLARVIGIQYEIKPPRLCCLKLSLLDDDGRLLGKDFIVKYHDMPDVLDFFVLKHMYDAALSRDWEEGDSFRCMIDDEWWLGKVIDKSPACQNYPNSSFLLYEIEWYNGERERMSPWDMEPIDHNRMPEDESQSVPVLHQEELAILYKSLPGDWPEKGREEVTEIIVAGLTQVMELAVAEPFLVPVDINVYPSYAYVIEYPIDLSTIKSRFENNFYRRLTAAQFDIRYLAKNAEKFNQRHSSIVKHARIVTELCLRIIRECTVYIDVQNVYHQLMNSYNSTDSEEEGVPSGSRTSSPMAKQKGFKNINDWKAKAKTLLDNILEMEDSIPFRTPVNTIRYPDYLNVIANPMDFGTVNVKLTNGLYESPEDFAKDMRLIFQNSRTYNTNKRSRIYVMTVRLSANFEEHIALILKEWEDYRHKHRAKSRREGNNNRCPNLKICLSESSSAEEPVDVTSVASEESDDNMPLNALRSRNNTESDSTNPSHSSKDKRIVNTKRVRTSDSEEEYDPGKQKKYGFLSSSEDSSKNNDSDDDDEEDDDDDDGCSKNLRKRPVKKKTLLYESSDSETNSTNRTNKRRKKESESDTSSWSSHQNSNGGSFMSRVSSRGRVRKLTERAKAMFK